MIEVTITIPLVSIPGVEVDVRHSEEYYRPEIVGPFLDKLALEFRGEASIDYPDEDDPSIPSDQQYDRATIAEGWHRLKKPRLVVMP
jgi:hypothetical protein